MERDLSAVVEWLRMLSLPRWVRGALACGIAAVLATGFVLIGAELLFGRADLAAAGATLVAVAVPVALVIVLLFAQGDHETLRRRTDALLAQTFPQAVRDLMAHAPGSRSVAAEVRVDAVARGFVADYSIRTAPQGVAPARWRVLELSVEVNVNKVNVVVWLPPREGDADEQRDGERHESFLAAQRSVLDGAVREGYEPHPSLAAQSIEGRRRLGLVLVKRVGDDNFLLKPQAALYWAQDLSFFVQGLLRSEGFDVREA
jgi:hypothetical protein